MSSEPTRLPKLAPADLDQAQRELYAAITGGPRGQGAQAFALVDSGGGLEGPFNAMLLQPDVGEALQALGTAIRYRGVLSDRAREIAILVVAYAQDSAFEVYAHEAVATAIGLEEPVLADLPDGSFDRLTDPTERLVATTARRLVIDGDLDPETYAGAVAGLGQAALFELVTLVGYYRTLALVLRVFRVPAPVES